MRGFPKYLATKQDYLNCLQLFPERTKAALIALKNDRFRWKETNKLASRDEGIEDVTHRIGNDDNGFVQLERVEDVNARMFKLGFTLEEINELAR